MNVIVTGSLGHIGKPLATELIEKGHTVTVISSKPEKQPAIEALGATAAIGSLEDVDFLVTTFTGADAVFAMVPPSFTEPDQIAYYRRLSHNYVQAIQQSGVNHVVHLSSYGADLDQGTGFILGAHHAEKILDELSDVAITHLRPGYFYYNLFNFVDMIRGAGFIGANYGGNDKIVLVDPVDIAAVAVETLTTSATGRNVRYIASDEHTASEVAHILGVAIGKPDLGWVTFTDEQMQDGMEKNGVPTTIAVNFIEMGASLHSGALLQDYELHKPSIMGSVKLKDFAREFAAVFMQKETV